MLKTITVWSRVASTSGSSPYGVVASFSISRIDASTPSDSPPWIPAWMKIGTLTSSPAERISAWPRAGSLSATLRTCSHTWKSWRCSTVSSALMVTPYIGRPRAEWPMTSTSIRPSLSDRMRSSVQPIA